jgi:hypothetical protein
VLFLIKNSFFNARARAGKKLGFTTNLSLLNYQKVSRFITLTEFSASRYVKAGFNKDRLVVKPNFLPARARALKNEFLIKNNKYYENELHQV